MCRSMQEIMTVSDWKDVMNAKLGNKISTEFVLSFSESEPTEFTEFNGEVVLDIVPGVFFPKIDHRIDDFFIKEIHNDFHRRKRVSSKPISKLRNQYIAKALIYFRDKKEDGMPQEYHLDTKEKDFLTKRIAVYAKKP